MKYEPIPLKKIGTFFVSISICLAGAALSGYITTPSIKTWYPTLIQPFFKPPNYVFPIIWNILYVMIGCSLAVIINKKDSPSLKKKAYLAFSLQLFFNLIWSFIFFGAHDITLAWVDLNLLIISLVINIYYFYKISKFASYLLIPYLLWGLFANILNGSIWYLNIYGK